MAFWSLAALRSILATETDADSPGSEELLGQMRENWEALTMLAFDTGITTTCTAIAEEVIVLSIFGLNNDGTPNLNDILFMQVCSLLLSTALFVFF